MVKLTRQQMSLLLKHAPTIGVSGIASKYFAYPIEDTLGRNFVWHYKSNAIVYLSDASSVTAISISDDDLLAMVLLPSEEAKDSYFAHILMST